MKHRILIILIFISHYIVAQNSQNLIDESIKYIRSEENCELDKVYPNIWTEYIKENIPYYNLAINELEKENYTSAINNLDSIVTEGFLLDEILLDTEFSKLHNHEDWYNFEKRVEEIKSKYNNDIRKKLIAVRNKDQSMRLILLYARKLEDSTITKKINSKLKDIDKESAKIVSEIIDKFGWLGSDEIGSEANQTLFLGIQHIDDLVVQNKYLPVLKEAVKNGKAEPWHLAFLTDRILMNQGKKQIYGTQTIISRNPENSYVVPIQNPEKVNDLRKEIGLEPLNEYLNEQGLSWDIDEYYKNLPRIEKLYMERENNKSK
ncbi:DUF6624 domain-containing protein [Riemerella anatipestifer]|uniref:DUF6624 domain-containing protein n=1 Tax=Riemerella anatipestifer TaxID=34085 RepID=UPI00069A3E67|nr:DUF6624 domain-containing protein [Riemerella anatipestifer]